MVEATPLTTEATIIVRDAHAMRDRLTTHFAAQGTLTQLPQTTCITYPQGSAYLQVSGNHLHIRITSTEPTGLFVIKTALAEHIFQCAAPDQPRLEWRGDGAADRTSPYFREMRVHSAQNVTPRMQRVTLAGDAAHFLNGGLHARLLIPPRNRPPRWPFVSAAGRLVWPDGPDKLTTRIYSIRQLDPQAGLVDLDIVLHEGLTTPGASWALAAKPGDRVGLMGPGGGTALTARYCVLAGDETALPAMSRIARELPADSRATLFIEVADEAEKQPLDSKADLDVHWLYRAGAAAGSTRLIAAALEQWLVPTSHYSDDLFVWVGCEHTAAQNIRHYLRKHCGLDRKQYMVASYWRRGFDADAARVD